jgi:hypothetical protein
VVGKAVGEKGKQNTGEIERLELEEMKNRNGGGKGLGIGSERR